MGRTLSLMLLALLGCRGDSDLEPVFATLDGRVGFELEADLSAYLDVGAGDWSSSDTLPPGIELDAEGWLTGVPLASGYFPIDVQVQADDGVTGMLTVELFIPTVALLSGYEPFGGADTNPSIEALWPLQEQIVGGLDLRVIEVPVVWDDAWLVLEDEIFLLNPDIVIATGQAGSDKMRFEINAVNIENGTDNDNVTRSGEAVVEGGPDTLPDRLPEDVMVAAMEQAGHATSISDDAGEYLCNNLFYHLMYFTAYEAVREDLVAGFIHVSPAGQYSSYSVEDITAAHIVGLEALGAWYESGAVLRAPVSADEHRPPVYFPSGATP